MIEVTDKMVSSSAPLRPVADHLGFVAEAFDGSVVDRRIEPGQNILPFGMFLLRIQ